MRNYFNHLLANFEARSLRERILIGVTLFAFTGSFWFAAIGGVVIDKKVEVVRSIDRLSKDMQLQTAEQMRLREEDITPARKALQLKQNQLEAVVVAQQNQLDALLNRFVAPEQVPDLLEDVLDGFENLKLVRLASQPAEPLLLQAALEAEQEREVDAAPPAQVTIYRHPVKIEVVGGYLDVMAYLSALEAAEWKFSWRRFEYVVDQYPDAQVLIELETLSREKEWLGV